MLLDQGASIEEKSGHYSKIPLMYAAGRGQVAVVRFLLERGADINAEDGDGQTALMKALGYNHPTVVQLLLERGADCCKPDRLGRTLLDHFRGNRHMVQLLEQAQARQIGLAPSVTSVALPAAPAPPVVASAPMSDVDLVPAGKPAARKNAYALVIGIEQYQQGLPKADFAARDAQVTKDYLIKVMSYQEENVVLLINERATKTGMEKYAEHWLPNHVEKDTSVFVYFSGHGSPNPKTGDAYLVPYDGDPAFVDATGYSLKRLYEQLG